MYLFFFFRKSERYVQYMAFRFSYNVFFIRWLIVFFFLFKRHPLRSRIVFAPVERLWTRATANRVVYSDYMNISPGLGSCILFALCSRSRFIAHCKLEIRAVQWRVSKIESLKCIFWIFRRFQWKRTYFMISICVNTTYLIFYKKIDFFLPLNVF